MLKSKLILGVVMALGFAASASAQDSARYIKVTTEVAPVSYTVGQFNKAPLKDRVEVNAHNADGHKCEDGYFHAHKSFSAKREGLKSVKIVMGTANAESALQKSKRPILVVRDTAVPKADPFFRR